MSDGYFAYPNPAIHKGLENISDLAGIEPLGADHPWITEQVELVKKSVLVLKKTLWLSTISLLQ